MKSKWTRCRYLPNTIMWETGHSFKTKLDGIEKIIYYIYSGRGFSYHQLQSTLTNQIYTFRSRDAAEFGAERMLSDWLKEHPAVQELLKV